MSLKIRCNMYNKLKFVKFLYFLDEVEIWFEIIVIFIDGGNEESVKVLFYYILLSGSYWESFCWGFFSSLGRIVKLNKKIFLFLSGRESGFIFIGWKGIYYVESINLVLKIVNGCCKMSYNL